MTNRSPKNWRTVRLDDISTPPQYGWTTKSSSSGKIKYLRTTDISSRIINWERVPYCIDPPDELEKFLLKENDIVISRAGSIGLSFIVNEIPFETVFASYLIRFRPILVDPYYVYYFLKSSDYWDHISRSSAGIAVQNVNAQKLANLELPLSPFQEQKRISSKLDKLFKSIYSIHSRLDEFPNIISELRQQILYQAITGELTKDWRVKNGVQKRWQNVKLKDHSIKIGSGATPRGGQSAYVEKGIPLIRSMNVHFKGFKYKGLAFINKKQADELKNVTVKSGDVLLNITGASIGRVSQAPSNMNGARVNQHVCIIRTKNTIVQSYLSYFLASPKMQQFIDSANYGVTRQALTKIMIEDFEILLPGKNEQIEIVKRIRKIFNQIDKIENKYNSLLTFVEEFQDSVLDSAYSGKLVQQNPKDEPVELLLERIKIEKEKLEVQKKELKKIRSSNSTKQEVNIMDIIDLLKKKKRMRAVDLWKLSDYKDDIDDFYAKLKVLVDSEKRIKEIRRGKESYLELIK